VKVRAYLDSIPDWAISSLPDSIWFKIDKPTEFLENHDEAGYVLCDITGGTDEDIIKLNQAGMRVEKAA
jgi:hypothetical protein